ncbi:MAG: hypothetical protein IPN69_03390 [Acidobacteria bacterium]|nr:hypothetical protein [Acidobacteriota bacterium]MBK8809759.1 hypothetical protein [Acidobacteriota bacterium]
MKYLTFVILLLFVVGAVAAQTLPEKPLTQAEYVKRLYEIQKSPSMADELIAELRRRGIGFEITDGIRGLTTSKSRNNAELKRALEEAARRKANPDAAKLPSKEESDTILGKAREAALLALEEMPDFVVKQQIQRSAAYAGTNNFRNLDRLVVAVSYRADGREEYKLLSRNGVIQENPQAKGSYEEVGGTSSTGEFVTVLSKIFKPESETEFTVADTDLIRLRKAVVFDFSIERDKAQQALIAAGTITDSTITGMKGKVWIDRENFRVLKIESDATEIPETFPIRAARRIIDYEWVKINDLDYLLPSVSDVRLTFRESKQVFETRNLIRFKGYQKYGSEVRILDGDEEEVKNP